MNRTLITKYNTTNPTPCFCLANQKILFFLNEEHSIISEKYY